jgi:hypothetical protein
MAKTSMKTLPRSLKMSRIRLNQKRRRRRMSIDLARKKKYRSWSKARRSTISELKI